MNGWNHSEPMDSIAADLVKAIGELEDIKKTETAKVEHKGGGSHSYSYANLADALQAIRPKLNDHGLALIQVPYGGPQNVSVATVILHRSGQWISFDALTLAGGAAQDAGSAISYARRYQALPTVGLATEDDDGAKATSAQKQQQQPPPTYRTREEAEIRDLLAAMDKEERELVIADFRTEFGVGLAELRVEDHPRALSYVKWLIKGDTSGTFDAKETADVG